MSALPVFHAKRIEHEGALDTVFFPCPACGLIDIVDRETELCRLCWRPFSLLASILREFRDTDSRAIAGDRLPVSVPGAGPPGRRAGVAFPGGDEGTGASVRPEQDPAPVPGESGGKP